MTLPHYHATQYRRPSVVDSSQDQEMIDLYDDGNGLTLSQIGERVGFSRNTVARRLRAHGVKVARNGKNMRSAHPLSQADYKRTIQLYRHLSLDDTGKVLGISRWTVRDRLRRVGVQPRSRHERPPFRYDPVEGIVPVEERCPVVC